MSRSGLRWLIGALALSVIAGCDKFPWNDRKPVTPSACATELASASADPAVIGQAPRDAPWWTDGKPELAVPGCGDSLFFIDTPQGAPTPCEAFAETVRKRLDAFVEKNACALGASPGEYCAYDCTSPGEFSFKVRSNVRVWAQVDPVFAPPAVALGTPRDEAHRRFMRVQFMWERTDAPGEPVPIRVQPLTLCGFIDGLRREAAEALTDVCPDEAAAWGPALCEGGQDEREVDFLVGRECPITGAAQATNPELLSWQFGRLGLDAAAPAGARGEVSADEVAPVSVAVIDTGADPAVFSGWSKISKVDGSPDTAGPWNPHAGWMLGHMYSVNPTAEYASYRALDLAGDGSGFGTTDDVARALDVAVQGAPDERPLVVNMSLGWPEVLSRPRKLTGVYPRVDERQAGRWRRDGARGREGACSTVEDGPGEAVRWMLSYMRGRERAGKGAPVAVFAAAGNFGLDRGATPSAHEARALGGVTCKAAEFENGPAWARLRRAWCELDEAGALGIKPNAPLFLPAAWGFTGQGWTPWAEGKCFGRLRLTTPMGAVNGYDMPVLQQGADLNAALLAPGAHVYLEKPQFEGSTHPVEATCGAPPTPGVPVEPVGVTGTSVATAFGSSVGAFVQGALVKLGRPALTPRALARFMYLTGAPLRAGAGSTSLEGVPAKRINLCGARAALAADAACLDDVLKCIAQDEAEAPLEEDLDARAWLDGGDVRPCADKLATCGVNVAERCPDDGSEPAWSPDWPDADTVLCPNLDCTAGSGSPCAGATFTSGGPGVVAVGAQSDDWIDRVASGIAGPQPIVPNCADCGIRYDSSKSPKVMSVVFLISASTTGTYKSALLTIKATTGSPAETIDLKAASGGSLSSWVPGARIAFSSLLAPVVANGKTLSNSPTVWKTYTASLVAQRTSGTTTVTETVNLLITAL